MGKRENYRGAVRRACVGIVFLLVCQGSALLSQNHHWEIGLNGSYAAPNNFDMMDYACGAVSVDATWLSRPTGNEYWRLYKHYPAFGFRGSFAYAPAAIYGHRFGLEGVVRAPLGKWFEYNLGVGLSTFTKAQCFTGDQENIFISSAVSCLIDVGLMFRLGDRMLINASLLHSSNGMLYKPNKGLNFLQLGVAVKLGNEYEKELDWMHSRDLIDSVPLFPTREWGVAFSPGLVMSRDDLMDGYYPCYDLTLYYQRYAHPVLAYGGAIDLWFTGSDWRLLRREENFYNIPIYLSAMGVLEFFWGDLSLKLGAGPVIISSTRQVTPFCERVGVYYNFGKHYVGAGINAHGGRIEFIEWTIGRRF
jgi:hypothetical protein